MRRPEEVASKRHSVSGCSVRDLYDMVRRRARMAGITKKIGNHTFRATGITAYLDAGGTLENAQVSLDEVQRIQL